ncbi:MAG: DNA-3-methyladenine glycosylase [Pseudonocardiales bacterium]|jgi:DNA-3-methyladenine glycosylase II|nr:DNA-3-methyladenine glycosylase [Pseudonocardiales bacterium]MDT4985126.1 DNA-3-methyladenine glycosylase [Pseudonocardiales bacterium]
MATRSFTIVAKGPFSLRESALFGFGQRMRPGGVGSQEPTFDGVMRLAFCLDGYRDQVGVELRQVDDGVRAVVHGKGDLAAVEAQVSRVLSLDHDATGFVQVGKRDRVIKKLQQTAPGLRPPLFYSPYEAATWSVLSARRSGWQMSQVRAQLSEAHGATFDLAGERLAALPTPAQLLRVEAFPGIEPARLERMHGVAQAAVDGLLDAARLRELGPNDAMTEVQRINGIGPFYAGLIVVRATGFTDVLPVNEPKALEVVRQLYDLSGPPTQQEFEAIAEKWRPWRTWATVLLRSVGSR